MELGAITQELDVAQLVLYVFWAFFAGLIFYLMREGRREGFPLVSEVTGRDEEPGLLQWIPKPKEYILPHGGVVLAPRDTAEDRTYDLGETRARPSDRWAGAPLEPVGNPMLAAIGPGAYAQRADTPDLTIDGAVKIVPMRIAPTYALPNRDADPRGMEVVGADGEVAGTIRDIWVDQSETMIRYYEVALAGGGAILPADADGGARRAAAATVLLPSNFADVDSRRGYVKVNAILAEHFATVPRIADPERVTLLEEDKIMAYYGGGLFYAAPARAEALL